MAETRMRRARRLLEVQEQLKRLEEARVAGLQLRQSEIAALHEELVSALNRDDGPSGLMVTAIVRRLKSLNEETSRNVEELNRRMAELQIHAGRAKWAERRFRDYEQQVNRIRTQKELLDLIERIITPKDASLP
jgi:hypothetical protein